MVDCVRPEPGDSVVDPARGTGGFLFAAHMYASQDAAQLDPEAGEHLLDAFISAPQLVDGTARLAA
jgi:type I restriction enzyme M protein